MNTNTFSRAGLPRLVYTCCLALLTLFSTGLLAGCQKYDDYVPTPATVQTLSASTTTPTLNQANADNQAIAFTWTIGTNEGTQAAIDYTLQLAVKGTNFATPVNVTMARGTTSQTYTSNAFTTLLLNQLNLPVGTSKDIEVRVKGQEATNQKAPTYSNVVTVTATPYQPLTNLWLVGDATPNGWDINNATPLVRSATDASVFTYTGLLTAGEFKIATVKDFNAPFYRPTTNNPPLTATTVQLSAGTPDNKWRITTAGAYTITLNVRTMTISIVAFTPPAALWMVGDATPAGWNINAPTPMTRSTTNPNVFTYTGPLTPGEFKFPVATGNWGTDYYMPVVDHQPLTDTGVDFVRGGSPDKKWQVTVARNYTITLDTFSKTISIQ
ncbi:SusF/SusE family outer membrane protein [Hymenobacter sp. M29]|uniref:SusF/SusE family outer membrane protein n=1 Tax=Hymenobacter mellowenesis TaxID=3063995 RepID=A0ABT9AF97_9BACT|nr:SusF/SusE family outer membrane protein [Hymenobacter sp. M29]MDO7848533.1 SusF/SusE family outer membrane protein [Hymenobacter sp. M29]